ncbi:hypothetical protein E2C01_086729 [Portunus trituberculatus]|uniref:Uncharacterized protein n=1 Tax=Portunus trituberculatus TaxID=210409 RepID=A0A5B7JAI5_PORTR|nr:hypothetical protein [Portunus trituberculatus]
MFENTTRNTKHIDEVFNDNMQDAYVKRRVVMGRTNDQTVYRIRTHALGDPSDPKARMVPLYHGGLISCQVRGAWLHMLNEEAAR